MSHDFEPTDVEKEMLSYMKDIEVNQKQTELGEIISGAILDGQNQIHDLYKEKATSQQLEYRMRRAYIYWMDRLNKANDHQLQKAREEEKERCIKVVEDYGKSMSKHHNQMIGTAHEDSKMMLAFDAHSRLIAVKHIIEKMNHSELDQDTPKE